MKLSALYWKHRYFWLFYSFVPGSFTFMPAIDANVVTISLGRASIELINQEYSGGVFILTGAPIATIRQSRQEFNKQPKNGKKIRLL